MYCPRDNYLTTKSIKGLTAEVKQVVLEPKMPVGDKSDGKESGPESSVELMKSLW